MNVLDRESPEVVDTEVLRDFLEAKTLFEFGELLEEHGDEFLDDQFDALLTEKELELQRRADENPDAEREAELDHFKKTNPEGFERVIAPTLLPALAMAIVREHSDDLRVRQVLERELRRRHRLPLPCLPRRRSGRSHRPSQRRRATCKARSPAGRRPSAGDGEPHDDLELARPGIEAV